MGEYARLRGLADGMEERSEGDVQTVMTRFAEQLGEAGEKGTLQVSLGEDEGDGDRAYWSAPMTPHDGGVRAARTERPDIEVMISTETFWEFAAGTYSPVEALRDGRMRLRGDVDLAKRLLRHLAGPGGRVDCG